ncbi:uncharacterized protein LOC120666439 [Panicum virgatum]|uniref:uncharacterized protein LOC120666439 n=1 Tax=Panicum virgatum TaxID=38727 RepID=UPI0019D65FC5|nr:uncharacterized protein LOC120666439 [Panicum virgatum]
MVVGKVTLEYKVAVSVELLWKVAFSGDVSIFTKACVGMIDAIEVDGDGGPGSVTTMKLNPAVSDAKVFKTRLLSRTPASSPKAAMSIIVAIGPVKSVLNKLNDGDHAMGVFFISKSE